MKGRKMDIKTIQVIKKLSESMSVRDVAKKLKLSPGAVQKYKKFSLNDSMIQINYDDEMKKQIQEQYNMIQQLQKEMEDLKASRKIITPAPKPEPAPEEKEMLNFVSDPEAEIYLNAKDLAQRLYRRDGKHPPHDAVVDAWNNFYGSDEQRPYGKYPLSKFLIALEAYNKKPRTREMEYKDPE